MFSQQAETLIEDLITLLVAGLMMLTIAGSVVVTEVAQGLSVLLPIVAVALLTTYLLARARFLTFIGIIFSTVYGGFTVWTLVGFAIPEVITYRERLLQVVYRFGIWVERALENAYGDDNLVLVLLLGALAWALTHNLVWNIFRDGRLWRGVVPAGLGLLLNAYYYFGPIRVDLFVMVFLFLVMTLAARTNSLAREELWREARMGFTSKDRGRMMRGGMLAILVVMVVTWLTPVIPPNEQLVDMWERSDNPWVQVQDTFDRLFNSLQGRPSTTPTYYAGSTLSMGGPVNLDDTPVLTVYAPAGYRYYWRSKVFETYFDGRWWTNAEARVSSDVGQLRPEEPESYLKRRNVQQRIEVMIPATRMLYAAPEPVSFASEPVVYDVVFNQEGTDEFATITLVQSRDIIQQGRTYGVTSSVSIASENDLRSAGAQYPEWVRDRYFTLPQSITGRTRQLANDIITPYNNPYDAVRAIENYLRVNITYNEHVPAPPDGVEPVDYLLFERPEGYCTYYASAMAVMLRSVGIPARVAAGFSQGVIDPAIDAYVVAESDAHTWVEVYFPGYGWVEFEPTASRNPILRAEESTLPGLNEPGQDPLDLADAGSDNPEDETTGPEPTPTPFPFVPPEQDRGFFSFTLPVLVQWLLFGGVMALLLGIGRWFWMEQRGLHGLGDIARAYARLNVFAPLVGIDLKASDTPYERADTYGSQLPEAEKLVRRIVDLHVNEQYSSLDPSLVDRYESARTAREAWHYVRAAIIRMMVRQRARRFNPFDKDVTIR